MFGSGAMALIISYKEMNNIMKIAKSLGESGLLIKDVSRETDKNEVKEQKGGLINMLLVTLGDSLTGNPLTGKGTSRAGGGTIRVDQHF